MPRILIATQVFHPSHDAVSQLLEDLAVGLVASGIEVHVLTSGVNYMTGEALPRHEMHRGVPRDDVESAQWYKKAAEQGYPKAQYALAGDYEAGRGVAQDIVEAYPLWLAQYPRLHIDNPRQCGVDPPVLPKPNCPTPWATRALDPETWQFDGDHGCVLPSGVDADFNEYLGDDFDAFCGVEAMPETMPGADANPFPLNMSIQESNGDSGKTS